MSAPLKLGLTLSSKGGSAQRPQNVVSNSARVAEAERTISRLQEENSKLHQELNDIRALYKQLTTESTRESFDERRVNLLKSQVIQLERQNALLTESINSRSETVMQAENALAAAIDYFQSVLSRKESIREVRVSCTELDQIMTTLESARKCLCRMAEKTSSLQSSSKPLLWYGSFLRNCPDQPVTLFDICRGDIEHLNLKHVSRLESKLVNLYKELMLVSSTLRICIQSSSAGENTSTAPTAVYSRLSGQVQHSCDLLQDVCSQLLQLSLLVPAAPLPAINKLAFEAVTVENVIKVFGKSAKTRDSKRLIEALVKYVNISVSLAGIENQILIEELDFHRAIYKLQTQYVESLFPSVNKCYAEFESDVQEVICQPLGEILQAFDELTKSVGDHSLLHFIEVFRNHAPGLSEAVQKLLVNTNSQSYKGCQFSEYGTQFLERMEQSRTECKRKRDLCIAQLDAVKQQLTDQTEELLQIIGEKDQCRNGKESSSPSDIQTCYASNEVLVEKLCRPSECIFQPEDSRSTDKKLNDFSPFSDDVKSFEIAVPSPVAQMHSGSPGLPMLPVSNTRDQPLLCKKQVRSKRVVPGIVQQSLILQPNHDKTNFSEVSETFRQAKATDNHGGNFPLLRSTSFSQDVLPLAPCISKNSDTELQHQSDFVDSVRTKLTGKWSVREKTLPSACRGSSSFH